MQPWRLIAYDIADPRARRQCLRRLRAVAEGYQDSVFECRLTEPDWTRLRDELQGCMHDGDSLLMSRILPPLTGWSMGCGPRAGSELIIFN